MLSLLVRSLQGSSTYPYNDFLLTNKNKGVFPCDILIFWIRRNWRCQDIVSNLTTALWLIDMQVEVDTI